MKEEKGKKQKRIQGKSRPKKKKKRRVKRKNKVLKAARINKNNKKGIKEENARQEGLDSDCGSDYFYDDSVRPEPWPDAGKGREA